MARKEALVKVPKFDFGENRDQGKVFFIREWDAARADSWIQKVAFAANQGGGALPLDLTGIGWEGIAIIGINTFLRGSVNDEKLRPLIDELLECVKIVRDERHPEVATDVLPDDIEEVATRWWLRSEVVRVHINFSIADNLYALRQSILAKLPSES
jgi:hypothetical protein